PRHIAPCHLNTACQFRGTSFPQGTTGTPCGRGALRCQQWSCVATPAATPEATPAATPAALESTSVLGRAGPTRGAGTTRRVEASIHQAEACVECQSTDALGEASFPLSYSSL